MYVLNSTLRTLQVVLGGTITTSQLDVVTHYDERGYDETDEGIAADVNTTNNTTAVTIVGAPSHSGRVRVVKSLSVFNKDTASATVTVRYNDNGTTFVLIKVTLPTMYQLYYEDQAGWSVIMPSGARLAT